MVIDPSAHTVHAFAPAAETEPASHLSQAFVPETAAYFPAAQSVHVAEPLSVLYFPAAHAPHAPPSTPLYPALQTQLVTAVDCAGEYEFARHEAHVVAATAEYFPAPHHWQVSGDTAPTNAEAVPATQSWQREEYSLQYFPARHWVHVFSKPEPAVQMVIDPSAQFVHSAAPAAETVLAPHDQQAIK